MLIHRQWLDTAIPLTRKLLPDLYPAHRQSRLLGMKGERFAQLPLANPHGVRNQSVKIHRELLGIAGLDKVKLLPLF